MSQFGRYRVLQRLGQGGMAEVFEGVFEGSAGFRRRVAIKRLLPELSTDLACVRMFLDEAHIASQLHHANVVSVFDFGEGEAGPYQILELVDGTDLERLLRRAEERGKPLSQGLALHIAREVAHGLHAAHEARNGEGEWLAVVHRDVSPSNVLVSRDGQVKLSDFGIAFARARLERTEGAVVKGKLAYMSPEQATRGVVDRRSDVFALGCLLHTMLLGASPIEDLGELTQLAMGHELVLSPALDPALRTLLSRALASRAEARFASAAELAGELSKLAPRLLHEDPVHALSTWMVEVAGAKAEPAPPALFDALFALPGEWAEVAPAAASDVAELATHHPSHASAGRAGAAGQAGAELNGGSTPRNSSRRAFPALLGAFVAVLGALGVWFATRPDSPLEQPPHTVLAPSTPASAPAMPASAPAMPASAPAMPASAPAMPASAPATPASDALAAAAPEPAASERGAASHHERRGVRTPVRRDASASAALPRMGTLLVGGPGAQRAELHVDGRALGFAPKRVDLTLGEHAIVLTTPAGEDIVKHVLIAAEHTDSAPYRVMVP